MPEDYFGEAVAARYDESSADMFAPAVADPVVDFLADLAGQGAALELGIGTGRIALPLARRGIRVHGIDLSEAMVARLRAKPGAEQVTVTIGDFATTTVDGRFSVAYLVFNTIMNLTTQDGQVACFQNVAAQLEPGGCFVIEVMVPALQRLPPGETVRPFTVTPTHLGFDEYDVASQGLTSHHYTVVDDKLELVSMPFRYVWPSELDLMERLEPRAVHQRQHQPRLGLGEAGVGVPRVAGSEGASTSRPRMREQSRQGIASVTTTQVGSVAVAPLVPAPGWPRSCQRG